MESGYTAYAARKITGVTQRCLDYWDEREVVSPSLRRGCGRGSERRYSFRDLVKLAVVKQLRDAGISLQMIRKVLRKVGKRPRQKDLLATASLIAVGKRAFRVTSDPDALEDMLDRQLVFSLIAVDRIRDDVVAKELRFEKDVERHRRGRRATSV